jgi:hypothetical protein
MRNGSAERQAFRSWCRMEHCGGRCAEGLEVCGKHAMEIHQQVSAMLTATRDAVKGTPSPSATEARAKVKKEVDQACAMVYYVRFGALIKIGTSTRLADRIATLKTAQPDFELLAAEPGSFRLERKRHTQFETERVPGSELFQPSTRLNAHIQAVRDEHGSPALLTLASVNVMIRERLAASAESR